MAKNDSLEQATLVTETETENKEVNGISPKDVQYLRKDTHLLIQGQWYITLPCPYHDNPSGLVDEAVSWSEAKTPHHAGVLAEQRHLQCAAVDEAYGNYLTGLQEIAAAEYLKDCQVENLKRAQNEFATWTSVCEADPNNVTSQRMLDKAAQNLKKHEKAMLEAVKRVENTRRDNER
jgi:hypothetical protein